MRRGASSPGGCAPRRCARRSEGALPARAAAPRPGRGRRRTRTGSRKHQDGWDPKARRPGRPRLPRAPLRRRRPGAAPGRRGRGGGPGAGREALRPLRAVPRPGRRRHGDGTGARHRGPGALVRRGAAREVPATSRTSPACACGPCPGGWTRTARATTTGATCPPTWPRCRRRTRSAPWRATRNAARTTTRLAPPATARRARATRCSTRPGSCTPATGTWCAPSRSTSRGCAAGTPRTPPPR